MSRKLTFGELQIGESFICFPIDGDNNGHGGYLGQQNLFIKVRPHVEKSTYDIFHGDMEGCLWNNAIAYGSGNSSHFPDHMAVIKVG